MEKRILLDWIHPKKDLWKKSFRDIRTMLVTIGFPGSGSSLVGYLLNAHPNMVIADEPGNSSDEIAKNINSIHKINKPGIIGLYMTDLDKIFNVIFSLDYVRVLIAQKKDSSKKSEGEAFISRGGRQARYMLVPNQYQGRFEEAKVIGIKHSLHNTRALSKEDILKNFKARLEERKISLKFILAIRNPYDMISLRVKRTESSDKKEISAQGIKFITNLAVKNTKILGKVDPKDVFITRHEDMVPDPKHQLTKLCDFLQVSTASDYLDSCASRVVKELSIRRFEFNWTESQKQEVASLIEKYDFLSGYDWES